MSLLLCLSACTGADSPSGKDEEWGMEGPLEPTPPPSKEDSQNRKGLLVATNTTATQVWSAKNKWEDKDTTAAKKAGLAWPENSGLNWDEKYGKWLESLERTRSTAGWYDTYTLTTPWGKSLPSPALECAEMSIFLRITFSAWYELPMFFETGGKVGTTFVRVYVSHNGIRTSTGKYSGTPDFGTAYKDFSAMTPAQYNASWPKDTTLRGRKLWDSEDNQDMLPGGGTIGTYLDEIHLNKRAGHFTVFALNYLSSINIADTANTYNIIPEAVRAGDTLLHRWQKDGIGHTLVVKGVREIAPGNLDVTLASGSMPRRQGKWETGAASKSYFVTDDAGGPGANDDGDEYAKLGGGLKRWRVAKNIGGYWTNTFMTSDEAHWINSTDYARIAARPERFGSLLGEVSPEQTRTELLAQIADTRRHLQNFPASCSARERRERAFEQLYKVSQAHFSQTKADVDRINRDPMDYVLAELDYTKSKTCCWNSSTAAMYGIIKELADKEIADGRARGVCVKPSVFMNQSDGYDRWQAFADETGRGDAWKAWSEDETCAQRDVEADSERTHQWTDLCLLGGGSGGACTDTLEPNASLGTARSVGNGTFADLKICPGDTDFYLVPQGGTVKVTFTHSAGDLDLEAFNAAGASIGKSDGTTDTEQLTGLPAGAKVRVYGYGGATNVYTLRVN